MVLRAGPGILACAAGNEGAALRFLLGGDHGVGNREISAAEGDASGAES